MKKVLLVDDHTSFREMLAFVFDREPGFEVVAQVGSLAEARPKLGGVDLAVVDLTLCDGDGTDLISELYDLNPHGMVLVLTASREREVHAKAVQKGAAGVLHKSASVEDIIGAARHLVAGEPIFSADEVLELLRIASHSRELNHESQRAIDSLTPREREMLQALTDGLSDKEIAERLSVSVGTVGNHFMNIFKKLRVHSRLQALVFAVRHGIADIDRVPYLGNSRTYTYTTPTPSPPSTG
jgi:two-component system, NarL family, response regulator DevR